MTEKFFFKKCFNFRVFEDESINKVQVFSPTIQWHGFVICVENRYIGHVFFRFLSEILLEMRFATKSPFLGWVDSFVRLGSHVDLGGVAAGPAASSALTTMVRVFDRVRDEPNERSTHFPWQNTTTSQRIENGKVGQESLHRLYITAGYTTGIHHLKFSCLPDLLAGKSRLGASCQILIDLLNRILCAMTYRGGLNGSFISKDRPWGPQTLIVSLLHIDCI